MYQDRTNRHVFQRYSTVASTAATLAIVVVVATASPREKDIMYRESNNTKPPEFEGARDPIMEMRYILDVEGCFYTCACPINIKFRYAKNLFQHGVKNWWNFFMKDYSPVEKSVVAWE